MKCGCSRRRARAASASRSRAGSCRRHAPACASTTSRSCCGPPPTMSACWRTRSIGPAFPAGSSAAHAVRIRPDGPFSPSSGARSNGCRRSGSPNTCRSDRCPTPRKPRESPKPSLPADDAVIGFARIEPPPDELEGEETAAAASDDADKAVVAGALRAPWRWEKLIVDSAVIGGDPERWRRRLRGLRGEYDEQLREAQREDPESARAGQLERDLTNLVHLTGFALPVIDTLAAWPRTATWGEWLAHFADLAPRVLRRPGRVLRVLGELRPMAAIGPVTLEEARGILAERLRTLDEHPPANRSAACSSALRSSCAAASSRSCSCLRWPSGCFRRRRARIRCCSTSRCASRSTRAVRPGGPAQERAPDAAARGRARPPRGCGCRIRGSTSAARGRGCRRSTCSTSCAPSPAAFRNHEALQRDAAIDGRREARLAGAGGCRRWRSTMSSTTCRRCAS